MQVLDAKTTQKIILLDKIGNYRVQGKGTFGGKKRVGVQSDKYNKCQCDLVKA